MPGSCLQRDAVVAALLPATLLAAPLIHPGDIHPRAALLAVGVLHPEQHQQPQVQQRHEDKAHKDHVCSALDVCGRLEQLPPQGQQLPACSPRCSRLLHAAPADASRALRQHWELQSDSGFSKRPLLDHSSSPLSVCCRRDKLPAIIDAAAP